MYIGQFFSSDLGDLPVKKVFYERLSPPLTSPHLTPSPPYLAGFEPEYCIDSVISTLCNTGTNDPINRPTALKLELNDSFEYEIRAVKIFRPFDSADPTRQEEHKFEVESEFNYHFVYLLLMNVHIVQVYVSSESRPLTESQGEKLGKYHGWVQPGVSVVFIKPEALLPGRWVTILDLTKKPIVLSEVRVYGRKWIYFCLLMKSMYCT